MSLPASDAGSVLADLVECLAALGRSMQDEFDPRRFLEEFSAKVERLIPHDRLVIACTDDDRSFSVFAEHAKTGPVLHAEHYTTDFSPEGRYPMGEGALATMLEGDFFLSLSKDGANVAVFPSTGPLHRAGFIFPDNTERLLRGTALLIEESMGDGHVVAFVNEPMFRGWWRALDRLVPVKDAEVVAILGWTGFDQYQALDVDFSPAAVLDLGHPGDFIYEQVSAEIRASGSVPVPAGVLTWSASS